ncbi:MAG: tetratricopeptide repeat protein [Lentisphaeria bacterium]|nr:tetratricopeptide repeat protein [Lentisphaeria bacterium]
MILLRNKLRHNGILPVVTGFLLTIFACTLDAETGITHYRDRVSGDDACKAGDFTTGASFYRSYRREAEDNRDSKAIRDAYEREIDAWIRAGLGNSADTLLDQYKKAYPAAELDSTSIALWRADIRILQDRLDEAEKLLTPVLQLMQKNDPRRKQAMSSMAFIREYQKKYREAAELYDELSFYEGDNTFKRNTIERSILMRIAAKEYDKALKKLLEMPLANKSVRDLTSMKLLSFYLRLEKDPPAESYPAWEEILRGQPEIRDSVLYSACRLISDSFYARKDYKNCLAASQLAYNCASSAKEERDVLSSMIVTLEKTADVNGAAQLAMVQYDLFQGNRTTPEIKLRYCQLLINAKLNDSALKIGAGIFDTVQSKETREKVFRSLFKAFLEKNAFQHGEKLLDIYLRDQKDSAEYQLIKADLYYQEGRKKEAAALCLQTAEKDPACRDKAYRKAVRIYSEIRDYKNVVDVSSRILRMTPVDPVVFHRAESYRHLNDFSAAHRDYNVYLKLPAEKAPESFRIQAQFRIAEMFMAQGKVSDAERIFQNIFRKHTKSEFAPAAGYWLVHAKLMQENSVNAERLTWQLAERYPDSVYTYSAILRLASYYRTINAADRAANVLESAVNQTRHPAARARALYEKSLIAVQQKKYDLAEKTIQELLTQFPDDRNVGAALYLRGDIRRINGHLQEAIANYQYAALKGKDTLLEQASLGAEGDCLFALAAKADKAELYQKALACYHKVLACKNVLPEYRAMAIYKSGKCMELSGTPVNEVITEYKKLLYLVVAEQAPTHPGELFWIVKGIDALTALARATPTGEHINAAIEAANYLGKTGLISAENMRKRIKTLRRRKYRPLIQEIHKK